MTTLIARLPLVAGLMCLLTAEMAAGESLEGTVAKARRELEVLKIQQRLFSQVEYPRQMRELDAAIRLTHAEIHVLQERVRYYGRLNNVQDRRLQRESLQKAELGLLEAQLRRDHLVQERLAQRRSFADRCRLLELEIAAVRAYLAELERLRLPALHEAGIGKLNNEADKEGQAYSWPSSLFSSSRSSSSS